jgi:glutamate synthase (NADPH/NADH) small chain
MEQKELRRLEDQCIQEQPPACAAACPVHVDARALAAAVAEGNFAGAAQIVRKTLPFPGIISHICDQPCQAVCKRGQAGGAIAIRGLEKACLDWAADQPASITALPAKEQRLAIVGGGLSGLTAAFDLARKGYQVTVFEKEPRLGGSLWHFSEAELPRKVMDADLAALAKLGVTVRLGTTVGQDVTLDDLCQEFVAVYLAPGESPPDTFSLALDDKGGVALDPVSFATSREGVFAGGGLRLGPEHSPIQALADGRRAAISMDRYVQKVSLTAARGGEGSTTTRLFTSLAGVGSRPEEPMAEAGGYAADEAVREAKRCLQCQCLECVKVCEYLNNFGSYPRQYVRQVYNNLAIVMGHRHANKLINSCSICGLCKEVCPEDLHMGLVCKKARETLVDMGKMPPSAHDFPLRDMGFSNSDKCALARHQPGTAASRYLFYPGCQLSASAPAQVEQVYGLLTRKLTGGVGLMLRCCGAPADWSGRRELFQETLAEFTTQWEALGSPQLIIACSTCYEIFKTHVPQADIVSLWEVLDDLSLPEGRPAEAPEIVAVHDACSTRHEKQIHESVRNILGRSGLAIEELPLSGEHTECCGYGGLMFFANPELAKRVIDRRIKESPADYVAYCAMCRDYLAYRGKPTLHLLDLVLGSPRDEAAVRRPPSYSQRHENRVHLRRRLLTELWGENVAAEEGYALIKLNISADLQKILDDRQILAEDIQQVIDYAEKNGRKLLNKETGHFLAHHKPAAVTYWVEYTPEADAFVIHNAYCHRMEIVEDSP